MATTDDRNDPPNYFAQFDKPATPTPDGQNYFAQFDHAEPPPKGRNRLTDVGVTALKGAIGVPEAMIGIGDLFTQGAVGKTAEELGFRAKDAKDYLNNLYSDKQKAANKAVADAEGFFPTAGAMLQNPSTIFHQALESAPSMLAGGAVSRGMLGLAPRMSPIVAGALGEGAVAAGQNAEQVRQESPTGTLTNEQSAILGASGGLTGLIGLGAGGLANKLGIGEASTMLATGRLGAVGEDALAAGAQKGILRKIGEGALVEGVGQELPQSYQEQVAQNLAQGKPWDEGAAAAGAQGMLAGGLMGGIAGPLESGHPPQQAQQPQATPQAPPAAPPAPPAPAPAPAPAPVPVAMPTTAQGLAPEDNDEYNIPSPPAAPAPAPAAPAPGPLTQAASLATAAQQGESPFLPFSTLAAAQKQADDRTMREGIPYMAGDHPTQLGRFAALPVALKGDDETFLKAAGKQGIGPITAQLLASGDTAQTLFDQVRAYYPDVPPAEWRDDKARANMTATFLMHEEEALAELLDGDPTPVQRYIARQVGVQPAANMLTMGDSERLIPVASILNDPATEQRLGLAGMSVDEALQTLTSRAQAKLASIKSNGGEHGDLGTAVPASDAGDAGKHGEQPLADAGRVDAVAAGPAAAETGAARGGENPAGAPAAGPERTGSVEDQLYKAAVDVVLINDKASIALVQRHLQIGYNNAARLMERMERDGIVGPMASDGARTIAPDAAARAEQLATTPAPAKVDTAALDKAAQTAATSTQNDLAQPSAAQIAAGNYKKGHLNLQGLDISIENPVGSTRSGTDREGKAWQTTMENHYGYIKGTKGADKDHIDTFIGPNPASDQVFVVDQIDPKTGKFDEHKVMLGFDSRIDAKEAYAAHYAEDWEGGEEVASTTMAGLKAWLKDGNTTRPFALDQRSQSGKAAVADMFAAGRKVQAEQQANAMALMTQHEATAPRGTNADGFAVRHHGLRSFAWERPQLAQQVAQEFRADPATYAKIAKVTPEDVGRFADVIEQQLASKEKPVKAKGQATPAEGATVDYPNRQLGFQHTTIHKDDGYNINVWANIAAANMKEGDAFNLGGKQQTVESISGKTLKLKDAEGKVRTYNPDGVSWGQLQGAMKDQLYEEKLKRGTPNYARPLTDILMRDPTVQFDERGHMFLKDGGLVQAPEAAPVKQDQDVDLNAPSGHSAQFESYRKAIEAGKASKGMSEQITTDERLNDGEAGELMDLMEEVAKAKTAAKPEEGAPLPNATAPEHVQQGVDDRELGQIVKEFNQAQERLMTTHEDEDGEEVGQDVTNIFMPPAKGDVVRLNDKVKVYHKDHGWMTPKEAKAKIEEWKAHAQAQYGDYDTRTANSQKIVLSLFDLTGKWSEPWEEAGYQVYRFDIQDEGTYEDPETGEEKKIGDVHNMSVEFFNDNFGSFDGLDVYAVLAACPCTDFAVSGARHFAAKDADGRTVSSVHLVHQTLNVIEYFKPSVWALENPVGRIEQLGGLPPWRLSFDPNHLGDPYTKKTLIWGRFNGDLPIAPVEPTEGSKMHKLYGGKSQATKNARSATPEGFAYAFFMANNAADHPAMAIANKYDRLDRSLIEQAVAAGIKEDQIDQAVEDFYYQDLDDDAANDALRELIAEGRAEDPDLVQPEEQDDEGEGATTSEAAPAPAPAAPAEPDLSALLADFPEGATFVHGKGLAKDHYAVSLNGEHLGNLRPTPEEAVADAKKQQAQRAANKANAERQAALENAIADKLRKGAVLTDADLKVLNLHNPAEFSYLSPVVQRLLDISSRKVREAMGDALKKVHTDMGAEKWVANPRKALANAVQWAAAQAAPVPEAPTVEVAAEPAEATPAAEAPALGKEVSRYKGKYGEGLAHQNANQYAGQQRRLNPGYDWTVEEAPEFGASRFVVVQREKVAPAAEAPKAPKAPAKPKADRDQAAYDAALATALKDAKLDDNASYKALFTEGWEHALAGATKSTLGGGLARAFGYDAALTWAKTEQGRPWMSGQRGQKLENTGEALRRWFDVAKSTLANLDSADLKKAYATIKEQTSRVNAFTGLAGEGATPGTERYLTQVRDSLVPFQEWLMEHDLKHMWGMWLGDNQDSAKVAAFLEGKSYVDPVKDGDTVVYPGETATPDQRLALLRRAATRYMDKLRQVTDTVQGATSVDQAAKRMDDLVIRDRQGNYWSGTYYTDAYKALKDIFRDNRVSRLDSESWNVKELVKKEQDATVPTATRQPLTPPRLDQITRSGLTDYRKGQNVTPKQVKDTFGFADVGFGAYVSSKEQQDHLNYAYDAFMDLAKFLGQDPKIIGLGGQLHFTIGALGHGKFAAHFQAKHPKGDGTDVRVINLTKTKGDGTVAHEWFHALDHALSDAPVIEKKLDGQMVETWHPSTAIQYVLRVLTQQYYDAQLAVDHVKSAVRGGYRMGANSRELNRDLSKASDKQLLENANDVYEYLYNKRRHTQYKTEANKLGIDYWGNPRELIARAAEAYVADKLGGSNTYLVNPAWVGDGAVQPPAFRGIPYPMGEERQRFNTAFDALAKALRFEDGKLSVDIASLKAALPADGMDALQNALDAVKAELPDLLTAFREEQRASRAVAMRNTDEYAEAQAAAIRAGQETAYNENKPEDNNDSTTPGRAAALDSALDAGPATAELPSLEPIRGAGVADTGSGPDDAGPVRQPGGRDHGTPESQQDLGNAGRGAGVQHPAPDGVVGGGSAVSADYRPSVTDLARTGSWRDTAVRNVEAIELALTIQNENRTATPAEQAQLARYVGFGAGEIRNALFPVPGHYAKQQDPKRLIWPNLVAPAWKDLAERLDKLPREWQLSILQSTQYAHYTSAPVIQSIWKGVERLGFTGGKVLEPGMGIGSFNMLMPDAVHATSRYTGIEFDGPTAMIAKLLSPEQNMLHDDFIKRRVPKDYFDLAIGNPPFSPTKIVSDPEYAKQGFALHDYFFAKSMDRVRPGGLLVFVTSRYTMDKASDKARKYLADRADLLGAVRLPQTAFQGNAGTSVVTDVLFLRKRAAGEAPAGANWNGLGELDTKDGKVLVNQYYVDHPDMILGQPRVSGNTDDQGRRINGLRGIGEFTVVSYDADAAALEAKFAAAMAQLPANVYSVLGANPQTIQAETAKVDFAPSVKREGVLYVAKDGTLMRVTEGVGKALTEQLPKLSEKDQTWLRDYVGLRDLVRVAQQDQFNDGDWEKSLKALNKAYDKFRKAHGPIRDFRVQSRTTTDAEGEESTTDIRISKNRRLYREDYDAALVTALEDITEDGEIVKTAFLRERTIGKPVQREVKTVGDALAVSLDSVGHLDVDDIARRLGLSRVEAIEALGDQVFLTPQGEYQTADEYLSGDVVAKLDEAQDAARDNAAYQRNVKALLAAQPQRLGPSDITVKLGAGWVPAKYVTEFAQHIDAGAVTFHPNTESWVVEGGNQRHGRTASAQYGTADRSPSELLEAVLNSRPVKVLYGASAGDELKGKVNPEATTQANEVAKRIRAEFQSWVWRDTDRGADLVEIYNRVANNIAPRRFDGEHLTLPGVSMRYNLFPHQKRAIWRVIASGDTYLAHAVGAGKTIEMIAAGMEQKRLGLIKKPMYVVPNHMLEQFANEFMELYPLANIMVADDENFTGERRRAFVAAATLNAPDAVVLTHSAFKRISVKEESVNDIRDELVSDLEFELEEVAKDHGQRVRRSQLEQQIEAINQRFDKILGASGKDNTIKFEDIGVDQVIVDEAHAYRKLDFSTNQQIKGIDPNGSQAALDLYVKTRHLQTINPGRAMVFASGTPVTNTMGELYSVMRFFAPKMMNELGIASFDGWSRTFGEVVPALEPNATGKYEMVERFAKFVNLPELMSRVRSFMDVLTSEQLGGIVKRPEIEGGKPEMVVVPMSPQLKAYMANVLSPRLEISKKWKPSPSEPVNRDPVMNIITDGRFAALDPRFFGAKLDAETPTKLTAMADRIVKEYHDTADETFTDPDTGKVEVVRGGTQIVFFNTGFGASAAKNRGFDARAEMTKRLVAGGVKKQHIAWFEDADTDAKKEAMFKAMRNGQLRVLIGSAKKMGTGVNVQKRLSALHYFDAPWFPADVEQPQGRILRQGNQHGYVRILWYATKGTYDETMWQMVARKQRFIDQAFTGDASLRTMEDVSPASLFEQAAAAASGDPRAVQLAGLRLDVERYENLYRAHYDEQVSLKSEINNETWRETRLTKEIATYTAAFKLLGERYVTFSEGQVGKKSYDTATDFGQALKDEFNDSRELALLKGGNEGLPVASVNNATLRIVAEIIRKEPTGRYELVLRIGDVTKEIGYYDGGMDESVSPVGLTRTITNALNGIETSIKGAKGALAQTQASLAQGKKKLGIPFPYAQEMAEKVKELRALEAELLAEGNAVLPVVAAQQDGRAAELAQSRLAAPRQAPVQGPMVAAPDTAYTTEQTDTPAFRRWFGKSLVVDHNDAPQVMYHASKRDVPWFDRMKSSEWRKASMDTVGSWFSDNPGEDGGAGMYVGGEGAAIYPVYLAIQRPKVYDAFKDFLRDMHAAEGRRIEDQAAPGLGSAEGLRAQLKAQGYDGIAFTKTDTQELHDELAASLDSLEQAKRDEYSVKAVDREPYTMKRQRIQERVDFLRQELAANGGSTEFDKQYVWVAFEPEQIKSAIGNNGQFDPVNPSIVAQPETPYDGEDGTEGYNDPYEHTKTRPGTTAAQRRAGRSAVADLSRRIGAYHYLGRNYAGGSTGTVLGQSLLDGFVAGKPNQLTGHTIASPGDLATLAQVYRDPRFETFRVVFLRGQGVVGEAGYTSRLAGSVKMPADLNAQIAADKARFGADGYYLLHNHPEGKAEPSKSDVKMTTDMAQDVPGLLGHVIIDHNEYGVVTPDGQKSLVQDWTLNGVNFHGNPPVPHALLGTTIAGHEDVAALGKVLQVPDGHATLVLTTAGKVSLLVDVPMTALMDTTAKGIMKGRAMLRALTREAGAGGNRFIVLPDGADAMALRKWGTAGVVTDIVTAGGLSLGSMKYFTPATRFEEGGKPMRVYAPEQPYDHSPLEGKTATVAKKAGNVIKSWTYTKAANALVDKRGIGLQMLGRRQLVEIYGKQFPQGEGKPDLLENYQDFSVRMDAEINDAAAHADTLVVNWSKVKDNKALAELMHDATLAGFDPRPNNKLPDSMLTPEMLDLRNRYKVLSDAAKATFTQAERDYREHYKKVRLAVRNRIIRALPDHPRRAELLRKMDAEMFGQLPGIYFPLARFGDYVLRVQGPDGAVSVSRAETLSEAKAVHADLVRQFGSEPGHTVMPIIRSKEFNAARDAVGRGFLQELYGTIEATDNENAKELMDSINQLYLNSLPDLSWAKHGIHRKGTPGFAQDARRAYAYNMVHGARYLAKLHYADRLADVLDSMQAHVDEHANDPKYDQVKAQQVVDEMVKRHETYMNPNTHPLANWLTSAGFVFYLGLSPASAAVNLSQTALVAYPILGGKFGYGKAAGALMRASKDAMSGHNDMAKVLSGEELAAYNYWVKIGLIDVSMAHDIMGVSQGQDGPRNRVVRGAMKAASFLFHHAERFNRQATALAAYRLARENGMDHQAAMDSAAKDTYAGHFDYAAGNRPRIMQGNVARVLLLFKQYGQNMVYTFARNAALAFKGDTQAMKTVGGLLTTHALAAGVLGLPMVTTLLAAASAFGGDDDEPWDAQVALRNLFADAFGDEAGEVMAHGLSRLTPWDISSRVGLNNLLMPDIQEGLEGQRFAESAMAGMLGPMAGLAVNWAKGAQDWGKGNYQRALEEFLPAAAKAPIRALRYFDEGVQDRTGIDILPETTAAEDIGQALGFSPSRAKEAQEGKSAIYQQDKALLARRQQLMNTFAAAAMHGEDTDEAMAAIQHFNEVNPTRRIAALHLHQSIRARLQRVEQAQQGIFLPKSRQDARAAGAFANPNE